MNSCNKCTGMLCGIFGCRYQAAYELPQPKAKWVVPASTEAGCQPAEPLTEADVRRIVREELAKALRKTPNK